MTQYEKIISFLDTGKELTASQAASRFGVTNLSARVHELRADGYKIATVKTKSGKSAYTMSKTAKKSTAKRTTAKRG